MNVRELTGRTVLVTGANSGIGLEASVKLARLGAEVVMVARDAKRGEAALAEVERRTGSKNTSLMLCDFSSQRSIRAFAEAFRSERTRLDVLVNNAGTVFAERGLTEDGIERTFAVNHLGYFLLTNLLLGHLERSAPARIVNVASTAHYSGTLDFDDLGFERGGYSVMKAYGRSKLGNVLFTRALAQRLDPSKVTVNCLHPGAVATNIWSHAPAFARPILKLAKLAMLSAEKASDTIVFLAASPEVEGKSGGYYEKNRLRQPSRLARDEEVARRLWDVSARMVGLTA